MGGGDIVDNLEFKGRILQRVDASVSGEWFACMNAQGVGCYGVFKGGGRMFNCSHAINRSHCEPRTGGKGQTNSIIN